MVKGIVKTNKANDTKYIYLSKDCGFSDGQSVDIKFDGIGIYSKERLQDYFDQNKDMFIEIKEKIKQIRKDAWDNKFFKYGEIIGKYFDYGKLEWDDDFYFEKVNDYSASPYGDMDGGNFGYDFIRDFEDIIKKRKLTKDNIKKEITDFLTIFFLQKKSEEAIDNVRLLEVDMLKTFGFENKEHGKYIGEETTLFSNGIVQFWYDSEDFAYDEILNISTMREIDISNEDSNIKF